MITARRPNATHSRHRNKVTKAQLEGAHTGVEKILYTVDETAVLLGLSPWTIRKWIHEGRVTSANFGGSLRRIPRSEIDRLIAEALEPRRRETEALSA